MRRMDRYIDSSEETRVSRADINKELYETIGTNTRYTSFTDVTNANAIDLSSTKNYKTREGYHQMKEYQEVVPTPRVKKELEEFNNIYQERENRVYDINNALEEARKNRIEKDELEEKRNLKNTSYNILASLNPEELEKYRQEKSKKTIKPGEENLRELIDTITSKTLAGDIKEASSLLSDLMATSMIDKVEKPIPEEKKKRSKKKKTKELEEEQDEEDKLSVSQEVINVEQIRRLDKLANSNDEDAVIKIKNKSDNDFYTRSMDLSEQDFELAEEFKEKKLPLAIKILIFLIIVVVLLAVFYFLKQRV